MLRTLHRTAPKARPGRASHVDTSREVDGEVSFTTEPARHRDDARGVRMVVPVEDMCQGDAVRTTDGWAVVRHVVVSYPTVAAFLDLPGGGSMAVPHDVGYGVEIYRGRDL